MTTPSQSYQGLGWIAAIAFFMQALDSTILNTALPAISADLNESPLEMQMAIISYTLTVAALIPLSGWLADKFGTLKIFRLAVILFVCGSIACALSHSLNALIMSRILQGMGGALMMPVARLAILRAVPKAELVSVWNRMATAGLIGPVLGPVVGGWMVTHASWHWIFLINIPIGLLGVLIAGRYMPNLAREAMRFDGLGFLLFASSLVSFTLGLEWIAEDLQKIGQSLPLVILSFTLMGIYIWHAKHTEKAILPLSLFRVRTFRLGMLANLFVRLCNASVPFLMPLMLQVAYQFPADVAGWTVAPMALGSILTKPYIQKVLRRFGYKRTLLFTSLALMANIASLSLLDGNSPQWLIIGNMLICGICNSFMFTCIQTLTVSDLEDEQASAGSTLLSVMQQLGIAFGIAVASVILANYHSHYALPEAFRYTFLSVATFGIILFVILLRLQASDGEMMSKKR